MDLDTLEGCSVLAICWVLCLTEPEFGRRIMQRAGLPEEAIAALTEFMEDHAAHLRDHDSIEADLEAYAAYSRGLLSADELLNALHY